MGTGSSTGQGRDTTYGTRDARQFSAETSYWPELAGAKLAESSGTGRKLHSVAQRVGLESSDAYGDGFSSSAEDNERSGANIQFAPEVRKPHIGVRNMGPTSSSVADTHSGTYTGMKSSIGIWSV